jgi:hypothetical protein
MPDVLRYLKSFDLGSLHSVLQWLEVFKWDSDAEEIIREFLSDKVMPVGIGEKARDFKPGGKCNKGKGTKGKGTKDDSRENDPHPLRTVIGLCPKCGAVMRGEPLLPCSKEKKKRVFYRECSSCTYYAEIFERRGKHYEIEGG